MSKTTKKKTTKKKTVKKKTPAKRKVAPIDVGVATEMPGLSPDIAKSAIPELLPVLPVRGSVMFPGTIVPLGVGRPASRKMLDESLPKSKIIALFSQKDEEVENPTADDLHTVGTAAMVLKLIRQPKRPDPTELLFRSHRFRHDTWKHFVDTAYWNTELHD